MRKDLLNRIESHKDLTNVIVLTFNIDLMFLESIFLRTLNQCGHPSCTVFADAEELSRSFDNQAEFLSAIGRRVRVVPVRMEHHFRFHPKAVLLSGSTRAELLVGSGNMTYGGMTQNEELWTSFETDHDGNGALAAFRQVLDSCLKRCGNNQRARREITEAYDAANKTWVDALDDTGLLLWHIGDGPSLLNRMQSVIGEVLVDKIVVCAPYFDTQGKAIRDILSRWPDAKVELLVQRGHTNLTLEALDSLGDKVNVCSIDSSREGGRCPFIHGKYYAFVSEESVWLFTGSANCSTAALSLDGSIGNAEMLVAHNLGLDEFNAVIMSAINVEKESPELLQAPPDEIEENITEYIQVLDASFDSGVLTVQFVSSKGVIVECCINDMEKKPIKSKEISGNTIVIRLAYPPRWIQLEGSSNKNTVSSRKHWVDFEFALCSTSHQRSLAQKIESSITPTEWSLDSWVEVFRLLGDHLKYQSHASIHPRNPSESEGKKQTKVRSSDLLTDDYSLPQYNRSALIINKDEQINGLNRLLMQYFGYDTEIDSGQEVIDDPYSIDPETVERPATFPKQAKPKPSKSRTKSEPTENERKRAHRTAEKLVQITTDESFIRNRHQDLLSKDLAIVAVMLIAGFNEGWLTSDKFSELTHHFWTHMFFDNGKAGSSNDPNLGWLQVRIEETDDEDAFINSVGTVSLSAALAMWIFTCPSIDDKFEKAIFHLATRMSVAKFPWLWNLYRLDEVAKNICEIASRTGWLTENAEDKLNNIESEWQKLMQEGKALCVLEEYLNKKTLSEVRDMVDAEIVECGEIIWQGQCGFGIAIKAINRKSPTTPPGENVMILRANKATTRISNSYSIPVKSLLNELVKYDKCNLTVQEANSLRSFFNLIEKQI